MRQRVADWLAAKSDDSPYFVALMTYIVAAGLAANIALRGLVAAGWAYHELAAAYASVPALPIGYVAGLLCGASIIFLVSRIQQIDSVRQSLEFAESRIATEKYPKHRDSQ